MKPVNKNLLVSLVEKKEDSTILMPRHSKLTKLVEVEVKSMAEDCILGSVIPGSKLLVLGSMLETFDYKDQKQYLVPQSAVLVIL